MGAIRIPWKVSIVASLMGFSNKGIDASQLALVTGSLPGTTVITGIIQLPTTGLSQDFTITAINDNFADGTTINPQWKRRARVDSSVPGGALVQYVTFEGVDIVDPPGTPVTKPVFIKGNYTIPSPGTYRVKAVGGGGSGGQSDANDGGDKVPTGTTSVPKTLGCNHPIGFRRLHQGLVERFEFCDACGKRLT